MYVWRFLLLLVLALSTLVKYKAHNYFHVSMFVKITFCPIRWFILEKTLWATEEKNEYSVMFTDQMFWDVFDVI